MQKGKNVDSLRKTRIHVMITRDTLKRIDTYQREKAPELSRSQIVERAVINHLVGRLPVSEGRRSFREIMGLDND